MGTSVSLNPATNKHEARRNKVSVVIPAYNAAVHLPATLRSVFAQTARPDEIIVVDDGSSDETVSLATSLGVTVISIANSGPSAARNAGTEAASGEYIAYLDADDLWTPDKLARQIAVLEACSRPAFSFTDFHVFDDSGIYARRSELLREAAFCEAAGYTRGRDLITISAADGRAVLKGMSSYILPSSVLIRRLDVLAVGGWDESLRVCEDYEFFLRLYRRISAVAIMEPLLLYRRHAAQASAAPIAMNQGLFAVESRVLAAPERYPDVDVRNIVSRGFALHYRAGMWYARLGRFDEAVASWKRAWQAGQRSVHGYC